jgi:hypothetical protein
MVDLLHPLINACIRELFVRIPLEFALLALFWVLLALLINLLDCFN